MKTVREMQLHVMVEMFGPHKIAAGLPGTEDYDIGLAYLDGEGEIEVAWSGGVVTSIAHLEGAFRIL
jgi:hypothetical protein